MRATLGHSVGACTKYFAALYGSLASYPASLALNADATRPRKLNPGCSSLKSGSRGNPPPAVLNRMVACPHALLLPRPYICKTLDTKLVQLEVGFRS